MNTQHTITEIAENEIVVLLPCSLASGDPGDPLSNTAQGLITGMAALGYAPSGFGESNDNCIQLWFFATQHAVKLANDFIASGGI